jgi:hypothetical protein
MSNWLAFGGYMIVSTLFITNNNADFEKKFSFFTEQMS